MALARGAQHLGPAHEEAPVLLGLDRALARRLVEGRPAAAGVVLRLGAEELRAAAGAPVDARLEHVVVLAAERPLGSLLPEDAVLLRRQVAPPLRLRLPHLCRHECPFFDSSLQSRKSPVRYAQRGRGLKRPSGPRAGAARPRPARRSGRDGPRSRTGRSPASPPSPRRGVRRGGGGGAPAGAPAPPRPRARSRAWRRRRRRGSPSSPSPSARPSAPRARSAGSRSSAGGSRSP